MYCRYCGKELSDDAVFCQYCGKNLNAGQREKQGKEHRIFARDGKKEDAGSRNSFSRVGGIIQIVLSGLSFIGIFLPWIIEDPKHYSFVQFPRLMDEMDELRMYYGLNVDMFFSYVQIVFISGIFVLVLEVVTLLLNLLGKANAGNAAAIVAGSFLCLWILCAILGIQIFEDTRMFTIAAAPLLYYLGLACIQLPAAVIDRG